MGRAAATIVAVLRADKNIECCMLWWQCCWWRRSGHGNQAESMLLSLFCHGCCLYYILLYDHFPILYCMITYNIQLHSAIPATVPGKDNKPTEHWPKIFTKNLKKHRPTLYPQGLLGGVLEALGMLLERSWKAPGGLLQICWPILAPRTSKTSFWTISANSCRPMLNPKFHQNPA